MVVLCPPEFKLSICPNSILIWWFSLRTLYLFTPRYIYERCHLSFAMGSGQSRAENNEKIFPNQTAISVRTWSLPISCSTDIVDQVSQDVIKQLSDHIQSPGVAPERRANLDAHIRSRIQAELEYLRNEEEHVRQEIESALERENLSRERVMAGDVLDDNTDAAGAVRSSVALLGDLDQIRPKIDRFHARKKLEEFSKVETTNGAVISCYK
jgi:altered-inheritance-of-mitochondria protein 13